MKLINFSKLKYNLLTMNCIDVAKVLYLYARGIYSLTDVEIILYPDGIKQEIINKLWRIMPGTRTVTEIVNAVKK